VSTSAELPLVRPVLSLGEATRRLQTLCAIEDFASIHGDACLVVDFDLLDEPVSEPAASQAIDALERLACPHLAIARTAPEGVAKALWARFDVAVECQEDLSPVVAMCRRRPLAALALVQLLRHSEALRVHDGLIAESLVYSTLQAGPEFSSWLASRRPGKPKVATAGPAVRVQRDAAADGRERLRLSLNRPEKRNAFSAEMRDALVEGLHVGIADPGIGEILLDGVGPSFCSGGDLDEFGTLPDPATAHAIRSTRNAASLLAECADRVRADLHGACVGAGIELPAFAGRVVARRDAFFQLPETGLGLVPGAGGTVSLPRRIGRQRTAWMALSGARVDADTALRWGLVDEVLEPAEWNEQGKGGDG